MALDSKRAYSHFMKVKVNSNNNKQFPFSALAVVKLFLNS